MAEFARFQRRDPGTAYHGTGVGRYRQLSTVAVIAVTVLNPTRPDRPRYRSIGYLPTGLFNRRESAAA